MRQNRSFWAVKGCRKDPGTDLAPPHRVLLSPQRNSHRSARMSAVDAISNEVAHSRREKRGCVTEGMSMVQLVAFRRSLVALALCSAAFAASATPASARSHHGARRYAHAHFAGYHARRHYAYRRYRQVVPPSRWERGVAQMQTHGFADANASLPSSAFGGGMTTSGGVRASHTLAQTRSG